MPYITKHYLLGALWTLHQPCAVSEKWASCHGRHVSFDSTTATSSCTPFLMLIKLRSLPNPRTPTRGWYNYALTSESTTPSCQTCTSLLFLTGADPDHPRSHRVLHILQWATGPRCEQRRNRVYYEKSGGPCTQARQGLAYLLHPVHAGPDLPSDNVHRCGNMPN